MRQELPFHYENSFTYQQRQGVNLERNKVLTNSGLVSVILSLSLDGGVFT